MCAALANRSTTVGLTRNEVAAKGVDGVNIDYEGLNGTCSNGQSAQSMMTSFASTLRATLPNSYISIDTYSGSAGDNGGFFNIPALNPYVDSFMVMTYDMEYSNYSSATTHCPSFCLGPTAPLTNYLYNDTRAVDEYTAALGSGGKMILGVPYYGRKACVGNGSAANQVPTGSVAADMYVDASTEYNYTTVQPGSYADHRDGNDPSGATRWDTWYNTQFNCWRELYWDDTTSLGQKYSLARSRNLRGVGIWNLNYGGGSADLWSTLASYFGCPPGYQLQQCAYWLVAS